MADVNISLNSIRKVRTAMIGDRKYTVRRLGAGEELDLSSNARRVNQLINSYDKMKDKMDELKDIPEDKLDVKEVQSITKKLVKFNDEMHELQHAEFEAHVKMFDDGTKAQKHTRELLGSLSREERQKLIDAVFAPTPKNAPRDD